MAETSTTEVLELPDDELPNGEDSDEGGFANGLESDDEQSAQSSDEESDEESDDEHGESGWKAGDDSDDDLPNGSEAGNGEQPPKVLRPLLNLLDPDADSDKEIQEEEAPGSESPPFPAPPVTPSPAAAVIPPPVETNVRTSGRNKRARFEGAINALVACACGNRVSDAEIAERTKIIQCRNKSCSAKWVGDFSGLRFNLD